jgi:tRNA pseudouridine55 synthase
MSKFDFQAGELLLVDKPLGWTSFDVVNKLRYCIRKKLDIKKIKVGHAGTLDPLATGLLIICTGKKTKSIEEFMAREKEYCGSMLLDQHRPSLDFETKIERNYDLKHLKEEMIEAQRKSFIGEQNQKAPAYSAKRIDGKKMYELARKGEEVKVKEHVINIFELEFPSVRIPQVDFRMRCSKGTYVRSFARDFGARLNAGGVLSSLRRTAIGEFRIEEAHSLNEIIELIQEDN